jgi:hypothetical protein
MAIIGITLEPEPMSGDIGIGGPGGGVVRKGPPVLRALEAIGPGQLIVPGNSRSFDSIRRGRICVGRILSECRLSRTG